jgi:hypothetical protein
MGSPPWQAPPTFRYVDAWTEAFGALLTPEEAGDVVGSSVALARYEDSGAVIALTEGSGERVYPQFQFVDGRPLPDLAAAHRILSEFASSWTAAAWCVGPHPELDLDTPCAWAAAGGDPTVLLLVARRDAARLAH